MLSFNKIIKDVIVSDRDFMTKNRIKNIKRDINQIINEGAFNHRWQLIDCMSIVVYKSFSCDVFVGDEIIEIGLQDFINLVNEI